MRKTPPPFPTLIVTAACIFLGGTVAKAQVVESAKSRFVFTGPSGKPDSAKIITKFLPKKIVHPFAKTASGIDPKLNRTATFAAERAHSLLARVTVYWASGGSGSDKYTRKHQSVTGVHLGAGHCAVDPRQIPYGSRVIFPDRACIAVDTGSAVVNRKAARKSGRTLNEQNAVVIDRFFENKRQALAWANSHPPFMNVWIVSPNGRAIPNRQPAMTAPSSAHTSLAKSKANR